MDRLELVSNSRNSFSNSRKRYRIPPSFVDAFLTTLYSPTRQTALEGYVLVKDDKLSFKDKMPSRTRVSCKTDEDDSSDEESDSDEDDEDDKDKPIGLGSDHMRLPGADTALDELAEDYLDFNGLVLYQRVFLFSSCKVIIRFMSFSNISFSRSGYKCAHMRVPQDLSAS